MKYLCLVYHDEEQLQALPEREYDAIVAESRAHREELHQSGHSIVSGSLKPAHATTTIRIYNGEVSIVDGPLTEAKAQMGGFHVIDARDLNDAIRIAVRITPAHIGYVEVRPIRELDVPVPPVQWQRCGASPPASPRENEPEDTPRPESGKRR